MKQTDEALAKLIQKGIEVAEKTGNFVIEQAPDLLQEFYQWHIAENILGIVFCLITFIVLIIFVKRLNKKADIDNLDCSDAEYFFPIAFSGVGIIISFIFLLISIYQLVFILVAPKLYLIEYFTK